MKRIKYRLVALLLVLVTIFANIQPALALEDYELNLGVDILSAWNNWTPISAYSGGTMQYPGQWSYNSNGYIVNAENTDDMIGFYNPTTNYSDMDISISMGSWSGDDDTLGAMIRFSEDKDHNCTGYDFAYDGADINDGWFRGLYKINGKQFLFKNLEKVVDLPTTHWQRGNYETIRISAQGNNIKVWRNNTLIVNYTDPNPIEAGSYGFMSASQPDARFKGITGKATLAHFTASFDANDGTLSGNESKIVTSTKTYGTLPTATRKGYIFDGWYDAKTGGNKITSTDAVGISSDTTFYAHWTPVESTINFDANSGTVSTASKKVYYEQKIGEMPTPTKTGYTFAGWCTDKDGKGGYITSDYEIAWDTSRTATLYAQWTINKYKNKYEHWAWGFTNSEGNNGSKNALLMQTTYGEEIYGEEFTPNASYGLTVPNGFFLAQRFGNGQITGKWQTFNFGTKLTQPNYVMNFEYDYFPTNYTITYNLNGGTNNSNNPSTYNVLYGVTFSNPTKAGYDFAGWYDANGNKITGINEGCNATFSDTTDLYSKLKTRKTGNVSVTARWTPHNYTISYNLNSGSASNKTSYTIETDTFTLNNPTKTGYTFVGWTGSNGTTPQKSVSIAKGSTGNKSYTAVFQKNVYTITTKNTGSGVLSDSSKIEYADNTSVFIVPANGYTTSSLKIDGVSATPVTKYNFLNVQANHTVEATFSITQNKKMELIQKGYSWIDLKL